MAGTQGSHVPKFGNWDGDDDIPYTAFFESARKEKNGGAGRMNPNDPEENPEAFMLFRRFANDLPPPPPPAPSAVHHQINISDQQQQQKKKNKKSSNSPNSEKSNCSRSRSSSTVTSQQQQQLNHRRKQSHGRKSSQSSSSSSCSISNSFVARPPLKWGRNPSDDLSSRSSASVPKFGAWDERDPKSGEGFTVIFNKVKEEKQITAAKFPPVQTETNKNRETDQSNKPKHKMFCCLF